MDSLEYRGRELDLIYYRDRHIYTLPNHYALAYLSWCYLTCEIEGLPEIHISFRNYDHLKQDIEKQFLEHKETIDKIIDGMEIYGRD